MLIEDAIEPPKFAPDVSEALKEQVKKVVDHVPEGWYSAGGLLTRKVFTSGAEVGAAGGGVGTGGQDGPVAMEVSA